MILSKQIEIVSLHESIVLIEVQMKPPLFHSNIELVVLMDYNFVHKTDTQSNEVHLRMFESTDRTCQQ